jgi:Sec-independent protein translocase protein TatA
VFGIGPQELMIIALLVLIAFGPNKASSVARDVGRFVNEARRPVEEFKSELTSVGEDRNEPAERASDLHSDYREDGTRKRTEGSKPPSKGEIPPEDVRVPSE